MINYKFKNNLFLFVLCIFAVSVVFFPWEVIRNFEFVDLTRNVKKYQELEYLDIQVDFSKVTSEPLWRYFNHYFSHSALSADVFFSLVAIFCLFIFSSFIYCETKSILACLFLINPIMLDFILSQQRSSLTLAIIILISYLNVYVRPILYFPSFLIHTVGAVVVFINESTKFAVKKMNSKKIRLIIYTSLVAFLFALLTVFGRSLILGYFDDRRANEYEALSNSVFYALPWLIYSLVVLWKTTEVERGAVSAIYLMIFFWCSVFDFYGSRYLAIGMPFFYIALFNMQKRKFIIPIVILHQLILLYIWLKL